MSPQHELRAAQNEDLFRRLNERLHVLATVAVEGTGSDVGTERFVCECSEASCSRVIELTPDEYRSVRARGRCFVVFPDSIHTIPEVENVVERHARYWVVEKKGNAGEEAEALAESDPEPL